MEPRLNVYRNKHNRETLVSTVYKPVIYANISSPFGLWNKERNLFLPDYATYHIMKLAKL